MKQFLLFFTIYLISSHNLFSQIPQSELNALIAFYNATNGDNWANNSNWLDTNKPLSEWYGITETNGRVTSIDLRQNNLTGIIPDAIGDLTSLTFIDLAVNNITGEIPSTIGNIQTLEWLDLAVNNLTGSIPSELTSLTNLTRIAFGFNNLSGDIPDFTLQNLLVFTIDNNKFQYGDFEDEFVAYQNNIAQFLYTPQQNPDENFITEQTLNVGDNVTLNATLVNGVNTFYQWYFEGSPISGATSTTLELQNLQLPEMGVYQCYAFNSTVTGLTLRTAVHTINRINTLHPEYNDLVAFYNDTNGDNWINNDNWLTDEPINTWYGIGTLRGDGNSRVTSIYLNNNNLSGSIPEEIGNFSNLFNLELGGNNISGTVPQSITNLTLLGGLALQFNNLSGVFPNISTNTNLGYLFIYSNNFQFGDFENELTSYQTQMGSNFLFSPQNQIENSYNAILEIGNSTTLNTNVSGSQNNYVWYRTNTDGSEGGVIGNNSSLDITINTNDDYNWLYFYEATSPLVPGLILRSDFFKFSDIPSNHPDYNALVAIYNSTNGNNWTNNTNWLDNTKPIYSWYGITDVNGRVTGLSLDFNNLTGTIPNEIGELNNLNDLFLIGNDISGEVPQEIWGLTNIRNLLIGIQTSKQLTLNNGVSATISNLQSLEWLNLTGINISQPLPDELFDLPNLTNLRMAECGLSGNIPSGFGNIDNVIINGNNFEGAIPQEILNSTGNSNLVIINNYFDFNDLEPLVQANNYTNLFYSPQRTKDTPQEFGFEPGSDITLTIDDTRHNKNKNIKGLGDEYQWFKDDVAINGANSSTYIITNAQEADSGIYYCEIKNSIVSDLIIRRANITLNIGVGLSTKEHLGDLFTIYPNPVSNQFNIKLKNTSKAKIQLFDIQGKQVLNKTLNNQNTIVDISLLNSGLYLLHLEVDNKRATKRIIKQ